MLLHVTEVFFLLNFKVPLLLTSGPSSKLDWDRISQQFGAFTGAGLCPFKSILSHCICGICFLIFTYFYGYYLYFLYKPCREGLFKSVNSVSTDFPKMTRVGPNTSSNDRPTSDGGQFHHRESSTKVVSMLGLAPGNQRLSSLTMTGPLLGEPSGVRSSQVGKIRVKSGRRK